MAAIVSRVTEPQEKHHLEQPPERNEVNKGPAPELNDTEKGIDNPVGEVVSIVSGGLGLKGTERIIGGDDNGSEVG